MNADPTTTGLEITKSEPDFVCIQMDDAPLRELFPQVRVEGATFVIRTGGLEIPMRFDETPKQALLRWKADGTSPVQEVAIQAGHMGKSDKVGPIRVGSFIKYGDGRKPPSLLGLLLCRLRLHDRRIVHFEVGGSADRPGIHVAAEVCQRCKDGDPRSVDPLVVWGRAYRPWQVREGWPTREAQ